MGVAVRCSALQCVVVRCCVLQCEYADRNAASCTNSLEGYGVIGSLEVVLQCVAVCCSVVQCVAVCCSVMQCDAVCCSVLQCVAVCCSVL